MFCNKDVVHVDVQLCSFPPEFSLCRDIVRNQIELRHAVLHRLQDQGGLLADVGLVGRGADAGHVTQAGIVLSSGRNPQVTLT